jgi:hypothetical protein
MNTMHGVFNKFVNELLALLHKHLFGKQLFALKYVCSQNPHKQSGPRLHQHSCLCTWMCFIPKRICILGILSKMWCVRFKTFGKSHVAIKVTRHFPLAFCLLWMYQSPTIVELVTWHIINMNINGKVHFVLDSKTWHHIDATYLEFATNL